MNEEALTKQKFTEKYGYSSRLKKDYRGILEKVDNKEQCLSDLNALLRSELIKYEDYSHREFYETISSEDEISFYTKQVDDYLKSQQ
jgi:hypothetical protein